MDAVELRPVRPADRRRIEEICADVWGGHDYLPGFFDDWVRDPNAWFQAAEVDGEVVGVQRLRPIGEGVGWYEGLRVASSHQRQGIARAMLTGAVEDARGHGFREVRLVTGNDAAIALFRSAGFRERVAVTAFWGRRVEGGDPPPLLKPDDAERAFAAVAEDAAFKAYDGLEVEWDGAFDITPEHLADRARAGLVRALAGGRALAILRWYREWGFVSASFLGGSGPLLNDLLLALRFEADADGVDRVRVLVPDGHPGLEALAETGYDSESEPFRMSYFALSL